VPMRRTVILAIEMEGVGDAIDLQHHVRQIAGRRWHVLDALVLDQGVEPVSPTAPPPDDRGPSVGTPAQANDHNPRHRR
jgi:hypothetical protein